MKKRRPLARPPLVQANARRKKSPNKMQQRLENKKAQKDKKE